MAIMIYCLKCKGKKEALNPQNETLKNGRSAVRGVCPDCGHTLYRMGGAPELITQAAAN